MFLNLLIWHHFDTIAAQYVFQGIIAWIKNYIAFYVTKTIVMSLWNIYETIENFLTSELITENYCLLLKMALCVGPAAAERGRTLTEYGDCTYSARTTPLG